MSLGSRTAAPLFLAAVLLVGVFYVNHRARRAGWSAGRKKKVEEPVGPNERAIGASSAADWDELMLTTPLKSLGSQAGQDGGKTAAFECGSAELWGWWEGYRSRGFYDLQP